MLTLRCLGPLEVRLGPALLRGFQTRKACALLVYLACHAGREFSRAHLQTLLWSESPPDHAARSLRQVLINLRAILPQDYLRVTRSTVTFNPQSDYELDVTHFEREPPDPSLYRGNFLEGLDLHGAPVWEEWLQARREELQSRALIALEALGAHHAARGEHARAASYYHRALTIDAWRETVHQALMQMYALSGDRAAALAQYEKCRAALAQGLGVAPLEETQSLYRRIREGREEWRVEGGAPLHSPPSTLPFVGRGEAHARLLADWATGRQQRCRLTLVEGEAGLGKTRLVRQALEQATLQGAIVAQGQCVEFTAPVPYRPIVQALRQISNLQSEILNLKSEIGTVWLSELSRLLPELRERYPDLPPPLPGESAGAPQRLYDAVARYLQVFCATRLRQPPEQFSSVILFLDDLHWADRATDDLLNHLVRALAVHPVWFVGAYRPEETPPTHPLTGLRASLEREGLAQNIALTPLDDDAVAEIAAALSDDPRLGQFLQKESGGNPFIVSEMLRGLQETGRLRLDRAERWTISGDLSGEVLPERVEEITLQRVNRLPDPARRLLNFAVVIGEPFSAELLAEIVGEPVEGLGESLQVWQSRRLLRPDADDRYDFAHDKIQSTLYHHLALDFRKLLHERIGQTLLDRATRAGDIPNPVATQIAYHFERSLDSRRAAPYLAQAARAARQVCAYMAALEYYRRLLPLLPESERIDAWIAQGEILRTQARHAEAIAAYTAARDLAERIGAPAAQARAWNGLAWVQERYGDHRSVLTSAGCAETLARAAGEPAREELARALFLTGWAHFRIGNERAALDWGEQAVALCAELAPRAQPLLARSLILLGAAHDMLGNYVHGARYKKRALALYQTLGNPEWVGNTLNNLGENARLRGDFRTAADYYQQALAIAREIGDRSGEIVRLSNLGGARAALGEFVAAEADLRAVIQMSQATGERVSLAYSCLFLAEALLGQERMDEARTAARQALALGQELELHDEIGVVWRVLGKIAARSSEPLALDNAVYDAPACFAESARVFTENAMSGQRAWTLQAWAEYEIERGDRARGEVIQREAEESAAQLGMIVSTLS